MTLRRLSYPCRYADLLPIFGRNVPQICICVLNVIDHIYDIWGHLLTSFNQNWLSPANLEMYARVISQKGSPIQNCWGFIDGTVRPCCRPIVNQRVVYNGHKRTHAIKFQAVTAPNGLVANLFGPVEVCRHDSGILAMSNLLPLLAQHSVDSNGNILCIYGDAAYPLRAQLQCPFLGANLTPHQQAYNSAMSRLRVSVEWVFGDVATYFKTIDFKKNLKLGMSPIGKMYAVSVILQNAHTILYGNVTSSYYDLDPPTLAQYFI